jgi:hypothetical protein
LADWGTPPKYGYHFSTRIAQGVDGSEDRASTQAGILHSVEYKIRARGIQARAILAERLKASLQTGTAAVPVLMRMYSFDKLYEQGIVVSGLWPIEVGSKIYVSRAKHDGVNNNVFINCGGAALGDWQTDCLYAGGEPKTVSDSQAIDTSGVTDVTAPIDHVFRTARGYPSSGLARIDYTLTGLKTGEPAIVRLWFAVIDPSQTGPINVMITGQQLQVAVNYSPFNEAGGCFKAVHSDFTAYPDAAGQIRINLGPGVMSQTMFLNAIEIRQAVYDVVEVAAKTQFAAQAWLCALAKKTNIADLEQVSIAAPMLYGQPSINGFDALTPECDEATLTVKEPLGAAVAQRQAACSSEICGIEAIEAPPEEPPPGEPPVPGLVPEPFASHFYVSAASSLPAGALATELAKVVAAAEALALAEWDKWDPRSTDPQYSLSNGRWSEGFAGSDNYTSKSQILLLDGTGSQIAALEDTYDLELLAHSKSYALGSQAMYYCYEFDVWFTKAPTP